MKSQCDECAAYRQQRDDARREAERLLEHATRHLYRERFDAACPCAVCDLRRELDDARRELSKPTYWRDMYDAEKQRAYKAEAERNEARRKWQQYEAFLRELAPFSSRSGATLIKDVRKATPGAVVVAASEEDAEVLRRHQNSEDDHVHDHDVWCFQCERLHTEAMHALSRATITTAPQSEPRVVDFGEPNPLELYEQGSDFVWEKRKKTRQR